MGNTIKKATKDDVRKVYSIKNALGKGTFATVKRAVRKSDGKEFAIKVIKKSRLAQEELHIVKDEVETMSKVDHPNCVKFIEMYETTKKLYIVIELLTGGELFDRIIQKAAFSEKEAAQVVHNVASAIEYLHMNGIVHRDLKPENLLYCSSDDNSSIKITDFGLSKYLHSPEVTMTTSCGTPAYVAPEVLKNRAYGPEVDLWSLGVILYILLCGFPPFYHETTRGLYKQIKEGRYDFPDPYWSEVSESAKRVVKGLLTVNPKRRTSVEALLKDTWVAGGASAKKFKSDHTLRIRQYNARRQMRRCVQMILALNRLNKIVQTMPSTE